MTTRRRRSAFHAESGEEYLTKVKNLDSLEAISKSYDSQLSVYSPTDKLQETLAKRSQIISKERCSTFSSHMSCSKACPVHFNGLTLVKRQNSLPKEKSSSRKSSINEDGGVETVTDEEPVLPRTSIKIILLGDSQVKKDAFIDYLFSDEQEPEQLQQQQQQQQQQTHQQQQGNSIISPLDLKIKTHNKLQETVKYHMWIKTCNDETVSDMLRSIYMIYYKTVSSFIFLYSIDHRDSFLCLSQTVKGLLNDVGSQKFKGILVGLKGCKHESEEGEPVREVTTAEAEQLKEEAGLHHMEVDLGDSSQRDIILDLLENFKKNDVKSV